MIDVYSLIDRKNALRYMGCKGSAPEELMRIVGACEEELCSVMTPRFVYKVFDDRNELSDVLSGNDIERHLEGCNKVIILAATLGASTDALIRKYQATDVTRALVVDAEASAAAEALCDIAVSGIKASVDGSLTERYSPGYGDYPLEKQRELLGAVDAERKIGLFAGDSYMLTPSKSVTAVIGVLNGKICESGGAHNKCENCSMYDKCSVRRED